MDIALEPTTVIKKNNVKTYCSTSRYGQLRPYTRDGKLIYILGNHATFILMK